MSFVKRRGANTPNPAPPPVTMYNPNQHSTQELNQWSNPQTDDNWYTQKQHYQQVPSEDQNAQQHNYWQQPYSSTQNYNQEYDQYQAQYQPQNFQNNLTYNQQSLRTNPYGQGYQNSAYGNVQNIVNQQNDGEAWNQAWGDEDNFNVITKTSDVDTNQMTHTQNTEDSFTNEESWNWGLEDAPKNHQNISQQEVNNPQDLFSKVDDINRPKTTQGANYDLKPSSNPFPKRGKLETPQWSTESQISQESSDDILQTSESDKSHKISRNSTISQSPLSVERHDFTISEEIPFKHEATENATNFENKEIVSSAKQELPHKINASVALNKPAQTPPLLPPPPLGNADESKNIYKVTGGISHKTANKFRGSHVLPPLDRYQTGFHNQQVNLETLPDNSEQPDHLPAQMLPKVKSTPFHLDNNEILINDRNQYLETGELSEAAIEDPIEQSESLSRPDPNDSLPPPGLRRMIPGQLEQSENWVNGNLVNIDNTDREQHERRDTTDVLPPPGLRRMVPGQMEQNERRVGNLGSEPPSMSRMVLGQTERMSAVQMSGNNVADNLRTQYSTSGPPEGLHRMIPGESSPPESNVRLTSRHDDNDSDAELQLINQQNSQPRSATIGADTPPIVLNTPIANQMTSSTNRQDIIGSSHDASQDTDRQRSSNNLSENVRMEKNRKLGKDLSNESLNKGCRRDSIEGEPHETKVSNITNSIRNLTVGENLTDGQTSNTSYTDGKTRRLSRQESSDSEREQKKRIPRDKRSVEKLKRDKERETERTRERDRNKDRYTPDSYREKKYDRRRYKDRYYEDETDFYSDKEKDRSMRGDIDRDYDRKYSSLRKDKDRHRKDPRDYRRDDYYYSRRYKDEFEDERSRPSSRSDSMRDVYRERIDKERERREHRERDRDDREKDRYRRRRDPREVYNPYQGYAYDPYNPYYQQYQYYENLRRTNPQAYAEWYHKYYQQVTGQASSYGGEDRASVHSGRSSANDELTKDRYTRQSFYNQPSQAAYYGESLAHSISGQYGRDISSFNRTIDQSDSAQLNDSTVVNRLTPVKFSTAHLKASISSGRLLKLVPHYSIDGQNTTVELCKLDSLLANNEDYKEMSAFPGPLRNGVTHKKTIIEYCESKIRRAIYSKDIVDTDSYILMWELLILLIRQNGMVVGTDIAELLLKNRNDSLPQRSASVVSNVSSAADADPNSESSNQHLDSMQTMKEEEVTNKFREFLLYGSGQEALEWAMKRGLWGHALFLASKLDKRTYANVMMRFANGLSLNDPLQTLYQLLSGKMPAVITCVSDEKWGDWRPHLAMILSNSKQRPELICKTITALGDTLKNRGSLYAAQFCYLMAEVGFGKHDEPETRLVLLGADHTEPFPKFATNEAIHMTEIYEYACGLNNPDFVLPQFQAYKYLLATRLADYGILEKSLAYLEVISLSIISNPRLVRPELINEVCRLADKLKFYDPVGEVEDESEFGGLMETSRLDHSWLKNLRSIQDDYQAGLISHQSFQNIESYSTSAVDAPEIQSNYDNNVQTNWQQQYENQYITQPESQVWQPEQISQVEYQQPDTQLGFQSNDYSHVQYQEQQQQNYWSSQQQWAEQLSSNVQESVDDQQNFHDQNAKVEEPPQPQITLPNQSQTSNNNYKDEAKEESIENKKSSQAKAKQAGAGSETTQSTGWFGGIFSRLSLKPKNQMKLPDDSNPKIVYDQEKKRWVNLDEDPNDPANELKPPPKMSDLVPKRELQHSPGISNQPMSLGSSQTTLPQTNFGSQPTSLPTLTDDVNSVKSSQQNIFKMHRGRNLKNSYVDVFNPSGKPTGPPSSVPDVVKLLPGNPQMNFFIPQPISDPNAPVDFLTPGGVPQLPEQQLE